ncbi:MAG: DUF3857 domain-containing protein [Methyloligellaceae bacterium]
MRLPSTFTILPVTLAIGSLALLGSPDSASAQTANARSGPAEAASAIRQPFTRSVSRHFVFRTGNLVDEERRVEIAIGNASAAARVAEQRVSVNEHFYDLEIVEAATLKADGRRLDVPADRIVRSAARRSQSAVFRANLTQRTIVFPDAGVGDRLVFVVRYRQKRVRVPGGAIVRTAFPAFARHTDATVTVEASAGQKLHLFAKGMRYSRTEADGRVVHKWTLSDQPSEAAEFRYTSPYDWAPRVFVSSFADWDAAGRAFYDRANEKARVTDEIAKLAGEIAKGKADRKAQARAIFNWVASNIRHVPVSLDLGSWVPHDAAAILQNRYGDSKDHATLMRALLAAQGIEAHYALVNIGPLFKAYEIPMPAFGHVMLYLPEWDLYTNSSARASTFDLIPHLLHDKPVLRIGPAGAVAARTPPADANKSRAHVSASVVIKSDGTAEGESTASATGDGAFVLRTRVAAMDRDGAEAVFQRLYRRQNLDGTARIQSRPVDDRSEPYDLKVSFKIANPLLGEANGREVMTGPLLVDTPAKLVARILRRGRKRGFACKSLRYRQDITVSLPANWRPKQLPADIEMVQKMASYTARYRLTGNTLRVERALVFTTPSSSCKPSQAQHMRDVAETASRDADWRLVLVPANGKQAATREQQ